MPIPCLDPCPDLLSVLSLSASCFQVKLSDLGPDGCYRPIPPITPCQGLIFPAHDTGGLRTGIWFVAFMNSFLPWLLLWLPIVPLPRGSIFFTLVSSEQLSEQEQLAVTY